MSKKIIIFLFITLCGFGLILWKVKGKDFVEQKINVSSPTLTAKAAQQFILMGDVGTATPQQFQVAIAIKNKCATDANCQAVFILGDIIYEKGISSAKDPQLRTKLEEPYQDINLPFYFVFGNHEYEGCAECYFQFASGSAKWHFPGHYYRQDFDSVSFFVIDTEKFDTTEQEWLKQQLAESTARWKVVLGHRPIISEESTKKGENWNGKQQLRDIVCASADFYISGHAHLLEDRGQTDDCKAHFLISGAGGSSVRQMSQPFTGAFYAQENGFLSLSVAGDKLQYNYINKDGKVLFEQ